MSVWRAFHCAEELFRAVKSHSSRPVLGSQGSYLLDRAAEEVMVEAAREMLVVGSL